MSGNRTAESVPVGMAKRTCRVCGEPKDEEEFYLNRSKGKNGKVYESRRTECRLCTDKKTREYHRKNRDRVILNNCRKADKHRGLKCNLTRRDVKELIDHPCSYCGEDDLQKIGLDRTDNGRGYMKGNVVACCIRCNAIKRDMPMKLWERFIPLMRELHEEGAFGDWLPHNFGSNERGRVKSRRPKPRDQRLRADRD